MLDFVILVLASWRLAHMLVEEVGPFSLFVRLRRLAGITEVTAITQDGPQTGYVATNTLAEGLMCVWCVSVWTAALFLIGIMIPYLGPVVNFGARLLAISSGAIVVHELVRFWQGRNT